VLLVGLGGVGSYAAEQLVRAGVGSITIVDGGRGAATPAKCRAGGPQRARSGCGVPGLGPLGRAQYNQFSNHVHTPHPSTPPSQRRPNVTTPNTSSARAAPRRPHRRGLRRHHQPQPPAARAGVDGGAAQGGGVCCAAAGHQPAAETDDSAGAWNSCGPLVFGRSGQHDRPGLPALCAD
jgi:hypothetical protein